MDIKWKLKQISDALDLIENQFKDAEIAEHLEERDKENIQTNLDELHDWMTYVAESDEYKKGEL